MKSNISEVISEFIKNKREGEADPAKREAEEVKSSLIQKLVENKFGKKKK